MIFGRAGSVNYYMTDKCWRRKEFCTLSLFACSHWDSQYGNMRRLARMEDAKWSYVPTQAPTELNSYHATKERWRTAEKKKPQNKKVRKIFNHTILNLLHTRQRFFPGSSYYPPTRFLLQTFWLSGLLEKTVADTESSSIYITRPPLDRCTI